jgi:hypothetical protein
MQRKERTRKEKKNSEKKIETIEISGDKGKHDDI